MEDLGSRNRPRDKAYIGHLRTQHIITTVIILPLFLALMISFKGN